MASKKQMHGAAWSGWRLSCSQCLRILCFSCLWGFFSVQIISPYLGCTCGCPWVSPVAEKEETPSLASALYPKHSPGCHPSPHWTTHGHFKATSAEVTDPNDIPSFLCTALVTGCFCQTKILTLGRLCSTAVQRRAADSLSHQSLYW